MARSTVDSGVAACRQVEEQSLGGELFPGTRHTHTRFEQVSLLLQPVHVLPPDVAAQRVADVRRHLELCVETLKTLEGVGLAAAPDTETLVGVSPLTIRTVAACLSELLLLEWPQPHRDFCPDLCKLLDCPQQPVLRLAISHAVDVLERTRCRFKSKELKTLREDLQKLLTNSNHFPSHQENIS